MTQEVLVVGAESYVGRNIAKALNDKGFEVVALSHRNPEIESVEWVKFDISDPKDMEKVDFAGATVVNCAVSAELRGVKNDFSSNYHGALRVAEATKVGKFIHISSSSVYNLTVPAVNTKEESYDYHGYPHLNNYSHSKMLAEFLLRERLMNKDVNVIVLRPHGVYGRDGTSLLPRIASQLKWSAKGRRASLMLPNGGESLHTLTHIDNLISAVILAISFEPSDRFTAFNITDADSVKLSHAIESYLKRDYPQLEVVKFLKAKTSSFFSLPGKFPLKFDEYEVALAGLNRSYDLSLAKSLLKYEPTPFKVV